RKRCYSAMLCDGDTTSARGRPEATSSTTWHCLINHHLDNETQWQSPNDLVDSEHSVDPTRFCNATRLSLSLTVRLIPQNGDISRGRAGVRITHRESFESFSPLKRRTWPKSGIAPEEQGLPISRRGKPSR